MEIDPMDAANVDEPGAGAARQSRLNAFVAVAVALIATFMGICNVKDGNIVQSMQQAQADKIDLWDFYQARHIREEVMRSTAAEMGALATAVPAAHRAALDTVAARYRVLAEEQATKKEAVKVDAAAAQKRYDDLNYHDDQFDLADAMLAIAISLLAITSLTHKRWLFVVAMVPTAIGFVMGLAGLFGWRIHSDFIATLLS